MRAGWAAMFTVVGDARSCGSTTTLRHPVPDRKAREPLRMTGRYTALLVGQIIATVRTMVKG